jgi:hypothetical protein
VQEDQGGGCGGGVAVVDVVDLAAVEGGGEKWHIGLVLEQIGGRTCDCEVSGGTQFGK